MSGRKCPENRLKKRGVGDNLEVSMTEGNQAKRGRDQINDQESSEDKGQWRPVSPMDGGVINLQRSSDKPKSEEAAMEVLSRDQNNLSDPQNLDEMSVEVKQAPRTPLEVFPKELWTTIMGHVKHPKDIWNMLQAHPVLRTVWQDAPERTKEDWNALLFSLAFPHLEAYLTGNQIKILRRVCLTLKNSVDQHLESEIPEAIFHSKSEVITDRRLMFKAENCKPSDQLIREMKKYPDAKVLGCVEVEIRWHKLHDNVSALLTRHGSQIFDLVIHCGRLCIPLTPLTTLECIFYILERTPNLKKLEIRFYKLDDQGMREVSQRLGKRPLSKLPHLAYLLLEKQEQWELGPGTSFIVHEIMRTYRGQVQHLLLNYLELPPAQLEMKALSNLSIWTTLLEKLDELRFLQAPLSTVYLSTQYPNNRTLTLFPVLQKFQSTLKHLHLEACWGDGLPSGVELRFLETLNIGRYSIADWTAFNFLLSLPRLRQVNIGFVTLGSFTNKYEEGGVMEPKYLKKYGTLDQFRFKESQIWKELPRLQSVEIERVY